MNARRSILFLCTGNCCRSQMAEAMLRHLDPVRFEALSAGSQPAGYVHPLVLSVLADMHIPLLDQHSKSWEEFRSRPIDLLITVCDSAAAEVCPVWPDGPTTVPWPLPDPVALYGSEAEQLAFAHRVAERLMLKLQRFVALDWEHHDAETLGDDLEKIGQL